MCNIVYEITHWTYTETIFSDQPSTALRTWYPFVVSHTVEDAGCWIINNLGTVQFPTSFSSISSELFDKLSGFLSVHLVAHKFDTCGKSSFTINLHIVPHDTLTADAVFTMNYSRVSCLVRLSRLKYLTVSMILGIGQKVPCLARLSKLKYQTGFHIFLVKHGQGLAFSHLSDQ